MADDAGFTLTDALPRLLIRSSNLPQTARELAALLARTGAYFDRAGPVRLLQDGQYGGTVARQLTRESVVIAAHGVAQPYSMKSTGRKSVEVDVTLPDRLAALYLDMVGGWGLPPLHGIAYAPILSADGTMRTDDGYDPRTAQFCADLPDMAGLVPRKPSRAQA